MPEARLPPAGVAVLGGEHGPQEEGPWAVHGEVCVCVGGGGPQAVHGEVCVGPQAIHGEVCMCVGGGGLRPFTVKCVCVCQSIN